MYYDAADGLGLIPMLVAIDTTYSLFSKLTFGYSTGQGINNYSVRIRDIEVSARKSLTGITPGRYPVFPLFDTLVYSGPGIWTATFGYASSNFAPLKKAVGKDNGFSYHGVTGLDKGQPAVFNPGIYHSVFSVQFDGSTLAWVLDGTTIWVRPLYPLKIEMKDNGIGETAISKPQIRVTNLGSQILSGFKLRLWFSRAEYFSQSLITDSYYMNPSGITISQGTHPSNPNIVFVDIVYPASFQLAPGASTSSDGVQFGVHFNNYYPGQWQKSNDWSWQGITGAFTETRYITVYNQDGDLFFGIEPDSLQTPTPPIISKDDIFGFEKLDAWLAPAGSNSLESVNITSGSHSLKMSGGGYQIINSIDLATTTISDVTSTLQLDFYKGPTQPNPYWTGQLQLFVSCPSAGIYNVYIGQHDLTLLSALLG